MAFQRGSGLLIEKRAMIITETDSEVKSATVMATLL